MFAGFPLAVVFLSKPVPVTQVPDPRVQVRPMHALSGASRLVDRDRLRGINRDPVLRRVISFAGIFSRDERR